MWHVIYNAISRLVTLDDNQSGDDEPTPLTLPSIDEKVEDVLKASYPNSYSYQDINQEVSAAASADPSNRKTVQGTVTQILSTGYGLIDNDIVFTYDAVEGKERPRVGATVQVEAHRENVAGGWKAKKVSLTLDWNVDNPDAADPVEIENTVGKITKYDAKTGKGFINDGIAFDQDALAHGYKPLMKDWIEAELHIDRETEQVFAKNVRPLRSRQFEGVVTHLYPGYGYVENKTYFTFSTVKGARPEKGDLVKVKAIESEQCKGKWRATEVEKKLIYRRQHRATESPLQSQRMKELELNKRGIIISANLHVGSIMNDETKSIQASIRNISTATHTMKSCEACSLSASVSVKVYNQSHGTPEGSPSGKPFTLPMPVPAKSSFVAVLSVTAKELGRTSFQVIFDFGEFQIGRTVTMTVEDAQTLVLAPSAAATPRARPGNRRERLRDIYSESRASEGYVVPGRRVIRLKQCYDVPRRNYDINMPVKLPQYVIPKDLERAVLQDDDVTVIFPELNQGLNMDNFSIRFSALLHLEEIQMQIDMRQFDLERVSMKPRRGEYLSLEVPGLAEGRPSVMLGDKVIFQMPNANKYAPKYEGIVHEVLSDVVLLLFNEKFQESYQAEEYNVAFTFSRTPLRKCHQAADFARNLGMQVLFPTRVEAKPPQVNITYQSQSTVTNIQRPRIPTNLPRVTCTPPKPNQRQSTTPNRPIRGSPNLFGTPKSGKTQFLVPKINSPTNVKHAKTSDGTLVANFYNSKLNKRQKAAVVRVLQGEGRPTPYIIFGPPGTGKTVTIVEAILQVHQHMPSSRILACTPSNSAADLLTERLHLSGHIKHHELIRLNSFRRSEEGIPDIILQYCRNGDELEKIAHYRMLVCTCTTAGSFYQLGLKAGHFTHVFVDEAGQATEPETLIPAGLAVGAEGQIILAGDPMQLGPVLQSDISRDYGLDLSLLERLSKRPLYRRDAKKFRDHGNYDPLLVTKLVDNYRSHPALLTLSSNIFYHGELVPQAECDLISCLCDWEMLPNKVNCPLIFHGIRGEDLREGNSPSWFNPMEVVQVAKYLKSLLALEKPKIKTSDIGIITPYRKQVEKIRLILTTLEVHGVKVGSVEEFQGQERLVMLISTVRSTENLIEFDVRHHLGFVSNPKRFNVSITRAQALQIIVGNPHVLAKDRYWRALLRFCVEQDAYIGCDLPELGNEVIEEGDLDRVMEDDVEGEQVEEDANVSIPLENDTVTVNGHDEEEQMKDAGTPPPVPQTYGELIASMNEQHPQQQKAPILQSSPLRQNKEHNETISPDAKQVLRQEDTSSETEKTQKSSPRRENVQSNVVCAKEPSSPVKTNSDSVDRQPHCIQDANSCVEFTPLSPVSESRKQSERVHRSKSCVDSVQQENRNRNARTMKMIQEIVVANKVQGETASPSFASNQPLTSNYVNNIDTSPGNDVKGQGVRVKCKQAPGGQHSQGETRSLHYADQQTLSNNSTGDMKPTVGRQASGTSNPVQNARHGAKADKNNTNHKDVRQDSTPNSHENQTSDMLEQMPKKKKSPPQVQPNDPRCVLRINRRTCTPSQTDTVDSLYHDTGSRSFPPYSKGQSKPIQNVGDRHNLGNLSDNVRPAGARCKSPSASEASSEPSVHLSDDSGPEEFQDYSPTRSSSDLSIEEKSQQSRGWWTKGKVVRPPQPSRKKQHNSNKQNSNRRAPAGRGGGFYRPPKQRQADSNAKDYYIGLGRGRGRPMQMAAQMQENDTGPNRPFSFGRGNFQRM